MFINDAMRLAASLRWLSSDDAYGQHQLLVVVLDPTFRTLSRLKAERDRIHALSQHALILVLGKEWSEDIPSRRENKPAGHPIDFTVVLHDRNDPSAVLQTVADVLARDRRVSPTSVAVASRNVAVVLRAQLTSAAGNAQSNLCDETERELLWRGIGARAISRTIGSTTSRRNDSIPLPDECPTHASIELAVLMDADEPISSAIEVSRRWVAQSPWVLAGSVDVSTGSAGVVRACTGKALEEVEVALLQHTVESAVSADLQARIFTRQHSTDAPIADLFGIRGRAPNEFGGRLGRFSSRPPASPLNVVLELLDLPQDALPGVLLRSREEGAVWVSLPDEGALVALLENASRAAVGPGRRLPRIESILDMAGLAGTELRPETMQACSAVFGTPGAVGRRNRQESDWTKPETARVAALWRRLTAGRLTADGRRAPIPAEYWDLVGRIGPYLRDDHSRTLKTAAYAHSIGDWGSVVVNISRVIEGSLASSVFVYARGKLGVRLPSFLDWWDPEAGDVPEKGIHNFNSPASKIVGTATADVRILWRPPTLVPGLTTLRQHTDLDPRRSGMCQPSETARA